MGYGMPVTAGLGRPDGLQPRRSSQRKLEQNRTWYSAHRAEQWEKRNCRQPGPLIACCGGILHPLLGPPYRTACCGKAVLLEVG